MLAGPSNTALNAQGSPLLGRLNAVRLTIVLVIAMGYASTMALGPGTQEILNVYGYDPSWIGIQLLFFISGILALRSVSLGRSGLAYLSSRFWRNIPALAFLTLATLFILFPLFGTPPDQGLELWARLTKYVALTVFCIDPGIPLEGLLDDARYMCLVQGGIWTLRYGLILHILTAISGRFGLLKERRLLLFGAISVSLLYAVTLYVAVKNDITTLASPLAGLRLSYAFLIGMTAWPYKDSIKKLGQKAFAFPVIAFILATLNYTIMPWSPMIEIGLTLFWISLAWFALTRPSNVLNWTQHTPNLTLPVLLINWPLAQTLLLLNPDMSAATLIAFTLCGTLLFSLLFVYGFSKTHFIFGKLRPKNTRNIT